MAVVSEALQTAVENQQLKLVMRDLQEEVKNQKLNYSILSDDYKQLQIQVKRLKDTNKNLKINNTGLNEI